MLFCLMENEEEGERLANTAREKIVADYSHYAAAEKYESIYKKALQQ